MYPKEYFVERFTELATEELFLKLSGDLADNAREAVVELLGQRGFTDEQLIGLTKATQKAAIRSTKGTVECDYCGNSAKKRPLLDDGQRFCSSNCLHSARISAAAVDLTAMQIQARAQAIRTGACPACGVLDNIVEIRYHHRVASIIYFTRYERRNRLCCKACGRRANIKAFWFTFFLGWWGVPFGILMTPVYLIANIGELWEHRFKGEASDDLLKHAKLQLAEKNYLLSRH